MSSFNIFGAMRRSRTVQDAGGASASGSGGVAVAPPMVGHAPQGQLRGASSSAQLAASRGADPALAAAEAKRRLEQQFEQQQKQLLLEQQRQQRQLELEHQRRLAEQQEHFDRHFAEQRRSVEPVASATREVPSQSRKPTRITDLLNNHDEDDYALPMEDDGEHGLDDDRNSASEMLWGGGFEDVSREQVPNSFGVGRGGFPGREPMSSRGVQLPPLSSIGTSNFSTPTSVPRSPRSNVADTFAAMNFDRGSGGASAPTTLPPIRLRLQSDDASGGGNGGGSTTSKDILNLYGPTSKNSKTIRKKNSRSVASSTSRAVERAALVSSLPSPRKAAAVVGASDSTGVGASAPLYHRMAFSTDSSMPPAPVESPHAHSKPKPSQVGLTRAGSASTASKPAAQARPGPGAPVVKKCYVGAKASQFCHVCRRSNNAEFASCRNLVDGSCRKVVCDRCFVRHSWSWDEYVAKPSEWVCPHCSSQCPPKASCHLYSRINSNRLTKKEREALVASQRAVPAGGAVAGGARRATAPNAAEMDRASPSVFDQPASLPVVVRRE